MALRVLMTGNDREFLKTDGKKLRERGFGVYICDQQIVEDMASEIKPDIILINSKVPDKSSTDTYHSLTDNILYASLPVVFTLSEDDVYIVNRKRTALKEARYQKTDSLVGAIRMALSPADTEPKQVPLGLG